MPVQTKIQLRRDTAANWTSTNPTLASGEVGFETNTGKFKIGDGSTAWTSLVYAPAGLAEKATSLAAGATGSLPYQSATGTTAYLAVGSPGQVLMVNGGATAPSWVTPKLSAFALTSSSEFRSVISDPTGTAGSVVFSGSPSLTTPTISSGGANFSGTSGTTILKAASSASGTLTLPAETGTLITQESGDARYLRLSSANTITGALSSNTTISTSSTLTGATITASGMSTAGVVLNNASGVLSSTAGALPVANGGTGGTDTASARAGLRIYVQPTQPSSPVANDLWFW